MSGIIISNYKVKTYLFIGLMLFPPINVKQKARLRKTVHLHYSIEIEQ